MTGSGRSSGRERAGGLLSPSARDGIRLFNEGLFFEAHAALEGAWNAEERPVRVLYQGLLQVAVACLHLERGRLHQASIMLGRARPKLAPFVDRATDVDVHRLLRDVDLLEARLGDLPAGEPPPDLAGSFQIVIVGGR